MSQFTVSQNNKLSVLTTLKEGSSFRIEWTIKHFITSSSIKSPEFISNDQKYSWYLTLYPSDSNGYLQIYLNSTRHLPSCKYTFSLLNIEKKTVKEFAGQYSYSPAGTSQFMKMSDILNNADIILNNSLTILCEVKFVNTQETIHMQTSLKTSCRGEKRKRVLEELVSDLNKVMKSSTLSDITLLVKETNITKRKAKMIKYKVHKTILAARSPVFAKMFTQILTEIKIPDISPPTMKEIICYMYTGTAPNLKDIVEDVLKAAVHYEFAGLKEMCEDEILSQLNTNNAIKMLMLADLYNIPALKNNIVDYIATHVKEVFKSQYWKEIASSKSNLVQDIYKATFAKNLI